MANKVPNFSDLIHRVTASCLLQPLSNHFTDEDSDFHEREDDCDDHQNTYNPGSENQEEYLEPATEEQGDCRTNREMELVTLIGYVFETVSSMKKAYVSLQEAHCPWDADRIRLSDVAVVVELRRLAVLRERFRRTVGRFSDESDNAEGNRTVSGPTIREVVAPYQAAMEKLKTELNSKEIEVDNLREKLKTANAVSGGRKSRSSSHQSKRRVSCSSQFQGPSMTVPVPVPVPELFVACMNSVKEGSRSFASLLLSLMKAAHWDINATVKSINLLPQTLM